MQKTVSKLGASALGIFLFSSVGLHAQSFGNSPGAGGGFGLTSEGSFVVYGGAVGFTPTENINVTSVTLWLDGYGANSVSGIYASICGNLPNPNPIFYGTATNLPNIGSPIITFSSPAANNGSTAAFTSNNPNGTTLLQANTEYWLVVEPGQSENGGEYSVSWVPGGTPQGDAVYDGSDFIDLNDAKIDYNTNTPAFEINAAPEPSVCSLFVLSGLFWASRSIRNKRKKRIEFDERHFSRPFGT